MGPDASEDGVLCAAAVRSQGAALKYVAPTLLQARPCPREDRARDLRGQECSASALNG